MYFLLFFFFFSSFFLLLSNSRKLKWRGAGCPDEGQRRHRPPPEARRCGIRLAPFAFRIQWRCRRLGDLVRASCRLSARTSSQTLCKYIQSFFFVFLHPRHSVLYLHAVGALDSLRLSSILNNAQVLDRMISASKKHCEVVTAGRRGDLSPSRQRVGRDIDPRRRRTNS